MTKFLGLLVSILFVANAKAQSSSVVVFDCNAEIQIDVGQTQRIGMRIETSGSSYVAYFVGANVPGPLAATRQDLPVQDGLKVPGVSHILLKTPLTKADQSKITSVVVYSQGNFDDDAAGVRGAEFRDAKGYVMATGMFFGWGGPVTCR